MNGDFFLNGVHLGHIEHLNITPLPNPIPVEGLELKVALGEISVENIDKLLSGMVHSPPVNRPVTIEYTRSDRNGRRRNAKIHACIADETLWTRPDGSVTMDFQVTSVEFEAFPPTRQQRRYLRKRMWNDVRHRARALAWEGRERRASIKEQERCGQLGYDNDFERALEYLRNSIWRTLGVRFWNERPAEPRPDILFIEDEVARMDL